MKLVCYTLFFACSTVFLSACAGDDVMLSDRANGAEEPKDGQANDATARASSREGETSQGNDPSSTEGTNSDRNEVGNHRSDTAKATPSIAGKQTSERDNDRGSELGAGGTDDGQRSIEHDAERESVLDAVKLDRVGTGGATGQAIDDWLGDPQPSMSAEGTSGVVSAIGGAAGLISQLDCPCSRWRGQPSRNCPPGEGASVSQRIGTAGGEVLLSGTGNTNYAGVAFSLDIRFDALAEATLITVIETDLSPPAQYVDLSPVYQITPEGLDIAAALRLPYSNVSGVSGVWGNELGVYFSIDGTDYVRLDDSYENAGFLQATVPQSGYIFAGALATDAFFEICVEDGSGSVGEDDSAGSSVDVDQNGSCPCSRWRGEPSRDCPPGEGASVGERIGTAGGEVRLSGTGSTVGVPFAIDVQFGALVEATLITVTETELPTPAEYIDFSPIYRIEPDSLDIFASLMLPWNNRSDALGWVDQLSVYYSSDGTNYERLEDSYENAGFLQATVPQGGYVFAGAPVSTAYVEQCTEPE
jgi:hypothetical protein